MRPLCSYKRAPPRSRGGPTGSELFSSWVRPFPSTQNPGGDEDEQLIVLLGAGLVAEEVSENGDLPETRNHVVLVLVVDLEDAADDGRAAVANEDLPAVFADRQRDVVAERQVQRHRRPALPDGDVQEDRAHG